jgi:hypothetical protein
MGDLEIWGLATQMDCLSNYFVKKLEEVGSLDIEPAKLSPTWNNKRIGEACIMKRLDHFLKYEAFLDEVIRIKEWVSSRGYFNHNLVPLEVAPAQEKLTIPFKLKL